MLMRSRLGCSAVSSTPHHLLALALAATLAGCGGSALPPPVVGRAAAASVVRVVAHATIPTGTRIAGLEIGGLSALTYDRAGDLLEAIVDDAAGHPPPRLLRFRWQPPAPPQPVDWLDLRQGDGSPLPTVDADLEGLARRADGSFFVSSEGNVNAGKAPWVGRFDAEGRLQERLPLPPAFTAAPAHGAHHNLALEALVLLPDESALYAGMEGPLQQDEPAPPGSPARSRILRWDLANADDRAGAIGLPHEWLYPLDPVPAHTLVPHGLEVTGLVDLLPWGEHGERFLTLERSFVEGHGFGLRLYETTLAGADEVTGQEALAGRPVRPARKRLLAELGSLHVPIDNYEGMVWGPPGPDGKRLLLLVCDNNFNAREQTYLLALALGEPPPIE